MPATEVPAEIRIRQSELPHDSKEFAKKQGWPVGEDLQQELKPRNLLLTEAESVLRQEAGRKLLKTVGGYIAIGVGLCLVGGIAIAVTGGLDSGGLQQAVATATAIPTFTPIPTATLIPDITNIPSTGGKLLAGVTTVIILAVGGWVAINLRKSWNAIPK